MDLSKAFDTIDHRTLARKLVKYNFSTQAISLISSYLSNRQQLVSYRGMNSELLPLNTGVPQGSILGPLLFLIYINDLSCASNIFKTFTYADDSTLIYSPNRTLDSHHTSTIINEELEKTNKWFLANKLSLNIKKTKFIIFHKRGSSTFDLSLEINRVKIERVKTMKFLGLTINENLNWEEHIKNITIKISRAIGVMNRLKSYLPTNILLTIYFALVHSHFNNHILLWGNTSESIYKLQKKAVRIVSLAPKISHSTPFFKQLNILKVPDLYRLALLKFYYNYENKLLPSPLLNLPLFKNQDIHSYRTRNRHHLVAPGYHSRSSVIYNVVHCINSLTPGIRDKITTHSLQNIIGRYKSLILDNYQTICSVPLCYVCSRNQ